MPERRVARTGTLAAAAFALVLSACGSSGGATPSGPATTGSAAGGAVTSGGITSAAAGTTAADTTAGTAGGSTGSAASTPAAPAEAPAILRFEAPLLAGGALDGTTYTGKPVAFWFWAPW